MFTGIVESIGEIVALKKHKGNLQITVQSAISGQLKINQSVSHDGACLTVIDVRKNEHTVEAVEETLKKTTLSRLKKGSKINLERAMPARGRFDGHIVQGHVDTVAECIEAKKLKGSYSFRFQVSGFGFKNLIVEKGSVCINGTSLTVSELFNSKLIFSVAIIPYTFNHTTFQFLKKGSYVNVEFDVLGKYIARMSGQR